MSLSSTQEGSLEIPGYRIIRKIGLGGMSTVYLAEQISLQREVALKVLSPVLVKDKDYCERLLKEGKLVASLRHPNIVTIYDLGQFEDKYYFSMEYISGGTLRDVTKREPLPERQALKILTDLVKTVDFAHFKGIIHRDIKPHNILFRDDGTLILTDFGIAIDTSDGEEISDKVIHASPRYMSPEQIKKKDITKATDMYSIGIIFYEMLTGSVPFDGEDIREIAKKHLNYPIPKLPDYLSHYQRLVEWLLAKEIADRVPDTGTLLDRLMLVKRKRVELQQFQAKAKSNATADPDQAETSPTEKDKINEEETLVVNLGVKNYEANEQTEEIPDDIEVNTPSIVKPAEEPEVLEKTMLLSDDLLDDVEKAIEQDKAIPVAAATQIKETPFKVVPLNAKQVKSVKSDTITELEIEPEPELKKNVKPKQKQKQKLKQKQKQKLKSKKKQKQVKIVTKQKDTLVSLDPNTEEINVSALQEKVKQKSEASLVSFEQSTEEVALVAPKKVEKLTADRNDGAALINGIDDDLLNKHNSGKNKTWPVFAAVGMLALLGVFLWVTLQNKQSSKDNIVANNNNNNNNEEQAANQVTPVLEPIKDVISPPLENTITNDIEPNTPVVSAPPKSSDPDDPRAVILKALQGEVDRGRVDFGIERSGSDYRISSGLENALAKYTSSISRPTSKSLKVSIYGPDVYIPGEALLSNTSLNMLQQVAFVLRNHNGYRVVVIDKTRLDSAPQSSGLSLARANAVKNYLSTNGVSRAKISARQSNNILSPESIDIVLEPVI